LVLLKQQTKGLNAFKQEKFKQLSLRAFALVQGWGDNLAWMTVLANILRHR
jgi:hypothetical protein